MSARQNNRMEGWSQGVLLLNWSEWIGLNDNKLFIKMIGSADERHFTVFDRLMLPVSAARSQYLPQWKDHDTLREGELWSLKTNAQSTYKNLFQKLSRCGLDFSMCCYLQRRKILHPRFQTYKLTSLEQYILHQWWFRICCADVCCFPSTFHVQRMLQDKKGVSIICNSTIY